jgi:hypothetical protein
MLRMSELRDMMRGQKMWGGMAKSGKTDADVRDALDAGLVEMSKDGTGFVITDKGRMFVLSGGSR